MKIRKPQKPTLIFFCALFGMAYFNAFSSLDMNPLLKHYLILVPVQLAALIYFLGFRRQDSSIDASEN